MLQWRNNNWRRRHASLRRYFMSESGRRKRAREKLLSPIQLPSRRPYTVTTKKALYSYHQEGPVQLPSKGPTQLPSRRPYTVAINKALYSYHRKSPSVPKDNLLCTQTISVEAKRNHPNMSLPCPTNQWTNSDLQKFQQGWGRAKNGLAQESYTGCHNLCRDTSCRVKNDSAFLDHSKKDGSNLRQAGSASLDGSQHVTPCAPSASEVDMLKHRRYRKKLSPANA